MSESFGRNEGKWVDISRIFDSTSWRGIALDPNNTSSQYYGRARGAGEDYAPNSASRSPSSRGNPHA